MCAADFVTSSSKPGEQYNDPSAFFYVDPVKNRNPEEKVNLGWV